MLKDLKRIPAFDEIVFENRNKDYGAYNLRKKYPRFLLIAFIAGMVALSTAIITPYLRASVLQIKGKKNERQVVAVMENLDRPDDMKVDLPPPPPPPPEAQLQLKYVAPEVVDSLKPEEEAQIMTMDETVETISDEEVVEVVETTHEEVEDYRPPAEVFVIVEEMPEFPGGVEALMEYVNDHIQYPEIARENGIEGNVYVKFCVTYLGKVEQISILRGVDPSLDAEAIRLIGTLPDFKPGRQAGNPVNVWYQFRIQFQLLNNK